MKLKALSLAVTAAALLSGAAHAIVPGAATGFDATGTAVKINAAGASAQDRAVIGHTLSLCTGNIDLYTNSSAAQIAAGSYIGSNDTSVACETSEANLDFDANGDGDKLDATTLTFRKLSGGGSANGVIPVANATAPAQTSHAINTGNCAQAGTFNVLGTAGVRVWSCGTVGAQAVVPTVGFADVEPALFAPGGPNAIGSFNVADLETLPTLSLTFGVPVTLNLRNALQQAQGLNVGSDALADMPSLSRAQLTSLFSGKISSWNRFENAAGVKLPALAAVPPLNDRVHICRRTVGSGTLAQVNALFLGNPCAGESRLTMPSDNTPASTTAGGGVYTILPPAGATAVHEQASSGNLTSCLNALQDNNQWGIGLQSLETGSDKWRFIKIDGAAPTTREVADNTYFDWAENVITLNRNAAATSAARAYFVNFRPSLDLSTLNAGFNPRITEVSAAIADGVCSTGETCVGYLLPFNATTGVVPAPFDNGTPTMSATRGGLSGTGAPSMCRQPIIQTDSML